MALTNEPPDLLRGTVDLLILRTLTHAPLHGYAIAQRLRVVSEDVLHVGESSLYPSLQRLLLKGWVKATWGTSENNRRARYYTITAAGRKHLAVEGAEFERLLAAMARVMAERPRPGERAKRDEPSARGWGPGQLLKADQ